MSTKKIEVTNAFSLSKANQPHLELSVRVGCGRLCDYCPQDSYIKSYKNLFPESDKWLTLDIMESVEKNIPSNTIIHWTGFTEPLDCKDFTVISDFLHLKRYKQLISTTLVGSKVNQRYFLENMNYFDSGITFHLPDSEGLMKGKFDIEYSLFLEEVISNLVVNGIEKYQFFLIGNDWHPCVKKVLEKYKSVIPEDRIVKAKYLNTRVSAVIPLQFGLKQSEMALSSDSEFYCSYKRLNQGVLLPNGKVTICCQDYGLEGVLGSLETETLDNIYNVIENDVIKREEFRKGNFSPCKKCEHYRPITESSTKGRIS